MSVTNLNAKRALAAGNNSLWNAKEMFEEAAREAGGRTKGVAIILDADGGEYNWAWFASDMRLSEIVALLEIVKAKIVEEFG
ncbi:MAG: hypothetical protein D6773_11140 [Alphaproteobacteria bacterium]|nr:MAG: hypothetical protein D6773_11140 [Alphaproteobacteria bacterium]